jgi:hypothetical protein
MTCPQCGAETPDDEWNCVSCRVNLYWAVAHGAELKQIRTGQGLDARPSTPPFLVGVSKRELAARNGRGYAAMNKVRVIARRVIRGEVSEKP